MERYPTRKKIFDTTMVKGGVRGSEEELKTTHVLPAHLPGSFSPTRFPLSQGKSFPRFPPPPPQNWLFNGLPTFYYTICNS